jgi:putative ABC transport system permease protein
VDRDAGSRLAAAGSAIRALDREVAIYDLKTLDQRLSDVLARPRFYTTAIVFLAAFALLLAAVGAYGNAAYSVAQRKHEMGLRMALGASHQGIRALVVRENLIPLAAGMVAGIAAAAASGRFLDSLVVYAQPIDLAECVAGAAVLLLAGFAALWTATTSVLAIAPADALRAE